MPVPSLRPDKLDQRFLRRLFFVVLALGLVVLLWKLTDLLLLIFGSMVGAVLFHTLADRYVKWFGLRPRIALWLGIATFFLGMAFTFWLWSVQFGDQAAGLSRALPALLDDIQAKMEASTLTRPLLRAAQTASGGPRVAALVGGLAIGTGQALFNFIILLVGSIFFAIQPRLYLDGLLLLVPRAGRDEVKRAVLESGNALELWLLSQIVLMTTMGTLIGFGLWLAGLQSAAALGLLAGLSEFIPYVGPTLAMLPALALGAAEGGDRVIWVLVAFFGVRMMQSNFITPLVQRRVVNIPPALTLFAIIGFGFVFGTFGIFFSAPLVVVTYVLVKQLYVRDALGEDTPIPGQAKLEEQG